MDEDDSRINCCYIRSESIKNSNLLNEFFKIETFEFAKSVTEDRSAADDKKFSKSKIFSAPSMLSKFHLLICFLSILHCTSGLDLFVDTNLSVANGSSYPTLQEAISALYQGSSLKNINNTITLLPSCVGKTLTITNSIPGIFLNFESIIIQYQFPPASINSSAVCNQLPILSLANNSRLAVSKLQSFSLIGLSIQYRYNYTYQNIISSVWNFNLSNCCLDMTDNTLTSLPPTNNNSIDLQSIPNLTISNSFITTDGSKTILIEHSTNITVSSITIRFANYFANSNNAVVQTSQFYYPGVVMKVSNLQFSCGTSPMVMPRAIYSNQINAAYYSNISFSNCNFSSYTDQQPSLLYSATTNSSNFQNITLSNVVFGGYSGQSLLFVLGNQNASFSNIQITCNSSPMVMPSWAIYSRYTSTTNYSNISVANCDFSSYTNQSQKFIYAGDTLSSVFNNITFSNVTVGGYPGQSLLYMNANKIASISNIQVTSLFSMSLNDYNYFIWIDNYSPTFSPPGTFPSLANISIDNCAFGEKYYIIYFGLSGPSYLTGLQVTNFTVNNTKFGEYNSIFYGSIDPISYWTNSTTLVPITISFRNLNIINGNFTYGQVFYLYYGATNMGIRAVEPIHVEYYNVYVANNSLNHNYFFQNEGVMTQFVNLTAANNIVTRLSSFFISRTYLSSLFIMNSTFTNFIIHRSSALVSDDGTLDNDYFNYATVTRSLVIEQSYQVNDSFLYAETRPFILYNTTISNIQVDDDSLVIWAANPQSIVQNCTFRNITQNNSRLLQLGGYVLYANNFGYIDLNTSYVTLPTTTNFEFFAIAELKVFSGNSFASSLFYAARDQTSLYNPQNCVHFVFVKGNTFDQINVTNSEYVVGLDNFNFPNGSVVVTNNTFSRITGNGSAKFPIISSNSVYRVSLVGNILYQVDILGYAFLLQSSLLDNFFWDSNTLSSTMKIAAYSITADTCNSITVQNMNAIYVKTESNFISMTCGVIETQLVLLNSTFQNILQTINQEITQVINFISIEIQSSSISETKSIIIQGNIFENVTLAKGDGYTIETSVFSIFVAQLSTLMSNNSFRQINRPDGNIMSVSTSTLIIQASSYANLFFGDTKGALKLVFQNFKLINTSFENSKSLSLIGAGLMKLTTLDAENILNVNVSTCSFSNNTASYGSIFYIDSSQINFDMSDSNLSDNLVSENGAIYFSNNLNSKITLKNTLFNLSQQRENSDSSIIAIENSENVSVVLYGGVLKLAGSIKGIFINAILNQGLQLNIDNFNFTSLQVASNTNSNAQIAASNFGILSTDDIDAYFSRITVINLTLGKYPLITLNCNTKYTSIVQRWKMEITQSNFGNLNLSQAMIIINSDEYLQQPLNNLSLIIDSSSFSNINWTSVGNGGGLIASNTKLIGNNQSSNDNTTSFSVVIKNSNFYNLDRTQTSAIYTGQESLYSNIISIENNNFTLITCVDCSGAILNPSSILLTNIDASQYDKSPDSTSIKFASNSFRDITAQEGTIMSWRSTQLPITIHFTNNSVENIKSSKDGGVFYLNCTSTKGPAKKAVMNITNSSFENITSQNGGIIQSVGTSNLLRVFMDATDLQNIFVRGNGGIIGVHDRSSISTTSSSMRFLSSTTQNSSNSSNLGEIYLVNTKFSNITSSNGGILYELTPNQTVNISLVNNIFESVQVSERGGMIYANQPFLLIQNNSASEIAAIVAGAIIFSNSDKLNLNYNQNTYQGLNLSTPFAFGPTNLKIEVLNLSDLSYLALENYDDTFSYNPTVPDLTSYSLSQIEIKFTLIYTGEYGVQTIRDESSDSSVKLTFVPLSSRWNSQVYPSSPCYNSICTVVASSIILQGKAGDVYLVTAEYQSSSFTQVQQFNIRLRGCILGELNQTETGKCVLCPQGKYPVHPSDLTCTDCPVGANCQGDGKVIIQPGYYRSQNPSSLIILSCNDSGTRCLGGPNNTCSEGYTGPFCLQCDYENNYVTDSKGNCGVCDINPRLYALGFFYLLGEILYELLLLVISFKKNKKIHSELQRERNSPGKPKKNITGSNPPGKPKPAQLMVIFTTFTQIFSIFASFGLQITSEVINIPQIIGNPNKQAFQSLKCLFYSRASTPLQELQLEILLYVFSPIIKIGFVFIFEVIRMIIIKFSKPKVKRAAVRLGTVAIVLTILEQPNIIGALSNYLSCNTLDPYDDSKFVKLPNSVECFTPEYNHFRNIAVIPALVFWGIAVPLTIFLLLYKNRKILVVSEDLFTIFGHLCRGYVQEAYYWGIVIIVFKMLIFTLNSLLAVPDTVKCMIFLVLVQIYYEILVRIPPYKKQFLFNAELSCVNTYRVTLMVITLKLSYRGEKMGIACDIVVLLAAIFTGTFILVHIAKLYLDFIKAKIKLFKEKQETLRILREYHLEKGEKKFEKYHRRDGICIQRSSRYAFILLNLIFISLKYRNQDQKTEIETTSPKAALEIEKTETIDSPLTLDSKRNSLSRAESCNKTSYPLNTFEEITSERQIIKLTEVLSSHDSTQNSALEEDPSHREKRHSQIKTNKSKFQLYK